MKFIKTKSRQFLPKMYIFHTILKGKLRIFFFSSKPEFPFYFIITVAKGNAWAANFVKIVQGIAYHIIPRDIGLLLKLWNTERETSLPKLGRKK